jgi:hypothetical protein
VFEGIRASWSEAEGDLFVFRLAEHLERLRFGMKLMRFAEVYPRDYVADCVLRMLRANQLRDNVHIRLRRGRDVLVRLEPGGHADPLGRPHPGRQRPHRPAHPRAPGALLPHRARRGRRAARLADPGVGRARPSDPGL